MTTTTAEPEWDQSTRDSALALGLLEDSLCPMCGLPRWECQNGQEFVAEEPYRCGVTTARLAAASGAEERYQHAGALMWSVSPRPVVEEEPGDGAA